VNAGATLATRPEKNGYVQRTDFVHGRLLSD
jgi:hypothetical protein